MSLSPFKSEKMNLHSNTTHGSTKKTQFKAQPVGGGGANVEEREALGSSSSSNSSKKFRYICVLDFEAVFSEDCKTNRNYDMEIIEFPSVLLEYESSNKLRVVDQIQNYVQTRRIPKLNSECTALTGITQEMVNSGVTFEEALKLHTEWLSKHLNGEEPSSSNVLMATCGDWDLKTMIPHQVFHEKKCIPLVKSHLSQWCNVKDVYGRFMQKQKVNGMLTMLNGLNLELEGKHHSGIDDCKNIARVICELVSKGCSFDVTARLTCKHGESSRTKNSQVQYIEYDPKIALDNFIVMNNK
ncbi:hypothetical protein C9374_013533 [Naegleria lovaniensis]|uniref:Exonuclease domain-containing protein n=1 Tax=Naegleria lovaniensis TaxID=51637 RepID=A0AA88KNF8_NAELO|nr:uncharacterized protein C9374_013533 [Naegleria lovaniensis]KAG2392048.1 hypothetical protein C9374_013533 [Naegleria lovaniensis]